MAKMIPRIIDPNVKSFAEHRVFEWLRDDLLTKDWVVLHGYGIEKHRTLPYGEVDFLVLAPGLGFFALEVKGGRMRREEGMWVFIDGRNERHIKSRGPFEQAKDAIYSIMEHATMMDDQQRWKVYQFGYGVVFPDIVFNVSDLDADQKQVFDKRNQRKIGQFIIDLSAYHDNKHSTAGRALIKPDAEDVKAFLRLIRKDFDITVPLDVKIQVEEERLLTLSEQQNMVIDGLLDNPRCLINGLAGTGKTLLALKSAKHAVYENRKVALFCYNLLLAEDIKLHFKDYEKQPSYIGSFTVFMEEIVMHHKQISKDSYKDLTQYYKTELPALAIEVLLEHPYQFDQIIIDEAQDLFFPNYLDVMDVLLTGGLKDGRWYFFGDFTIQTIFNKTLDLNKVKSILSGYTHYVTFNLTQNCRNALSILKEMNTLIGSNQPCNDHTTTGTPVKRLSFKEKRDQIGIVDKLLEQLIGEGVKPAQITMLSPYRFSASFLEAIKRWKPMKYTSERKTITYSTIQGFKGLENDVIILLDIYHYDAKELIYIGMSRAKAALYILEKR